MSIEFFVGGNEKFKESYELAIIGGGPAGLTAALYAARSMLDHVLIEKNPIPGGQILNTELVENYPGFAEPVSGMELMQRFQAQAEKFGAKIINAGVQRLTIEDGKFRIITDEGETSARAVIISSGASPKLMNIEGEDKFIGKGISFCATCDGALYKDKVVAVIGGGDAAVEEALYLTKFASKVFIVHRRDKLRATKILQERAFNNPKIEFVWSHVPKKVLGEQVVEGLEVESRVDGSTKVLNVSGIFVYIGLIPNTDFIAIDELGLDDKGFIITDAEMRTNISGLFAAGDVRSKLLRQISTAVGDGANAAFAAEKYLHGEG